MKRTIGYLVFLLIVAFVAYNSVYFKKLDEVKAGTVSFDPAKYASTFWDKKLLPSLANAIETEELLSKLQTEREQTFEDYSHALGIGNIRYFLVKGKGTVQSVEENEVLLKLDSDFTKPEIRIATEYIFGNAVRDASGKIDINEFSNSMDFNNVSAEINDIIRKKVVPPFKANVKKGDAVEFSGAIELNKAHLNLDNLEIIPIILKINNK